MTSIKVAVRVRPMNQREDGGSRIIEMEGNKTRITNPKVAESGGEGDHGRDQLRVREFSYDYSFWSVCPADPHFVTQKQVYEALGPDVVSAAYEGYNVCVFAYGQTGSGKTHTMMGSQEDPGFIPRFCESYWSPSKTHLLIHLPAEGTAMSSYLEIYNEKVRDLLKYSSGGKPSHRLRIREHPKDGPYVQDLSHHTVVSYDSIASVMNKGNANRTTAATFMNDVSSRSHAIFTITFTQAKFEDGLPSERLSKIHLVDLAGSERADASGATGQRLKEGGSINRSLVTLGNVISVLAELAEEKGTRIRGTFIPYRDSVLTWLLKDSLGGNAKTIMLATISPADINYGETLSTLRYANRAKNIINRPTVNEDPNVKLIRELREEIARLKSLLGGNLDSISSPKVQEKLHENEARIKVLTEEWADKWRESAYILQEEKNLELRKEGLGVVLDSTLPHLIGMDDDILSTGIMLYHLKEGITTIGTDDSDECQDIIITGAAAEPQHCVIEYLNGSVTLHPIEDALCAVNGTVVTEPIRLTQGAVILLGRTNMFRFNHPAEAQKLKQMRKSLSTLSLSRTPVLSNSRISLLSHSMTDLYQSSDSLAVGVGWEFEENHHEEQDLLNQKRQELEELEEKYRQQENEWQRMQAHMEQQLHDKEQQLEQLQQQVQNIRIMLSPAQTIEEALQHLEDLEQQKVQETQQLKNDLMQELQNFRSKHTTSQDSLTASLTKLDQQLGCHKQHIATLKEENASKRQLLQADRQKEETVTDVLRSEVTAIRKQLKAQQEKVFSCDVELSAKYNTLADKESELRKKQAQLDHEKNSMWKKTLDGLSEENYGIEEAWQDLAQHEAEVTQKLQAGAFQSEVERMEYENEKDQLQQARVLLKEEEDRIAAVQQSEMERVELEMEQWTQLKENELAAMEQERESLLQLASPELNSLLAEVEVKRAAIAEQQKKCDDIDKVLARQEEDMKAQLSDLMKEQNNLEEQRKKMMEQVFLGEGERKKVEMDIQERLRQLQTSADQQLQKIHTERARLLGLRKAGKGPQSQCDVQGKDTEAAEVLQEQHKALEERTQECAQLQEQISVLQEELSSWQRQLEEKRDRDLDTIEFKKLQLRDLERQERINALVGQEVKQRLFEEKMEREKKRRGERERERQEREREIQRLKSLHEREIRQLRANLEKSSDVSRYIPYGSCSTLTSLFEENRKKLVQQLSSTGPPASIHITIPNYALRGTGRDAHFEYEVKIKIGDELWSVFRRYSRFRELHQAMRKKYPTVDVLVFPPRRLFHKTEKVAAERRFLLERYLNSLVEMCMQHPDCPLHPDNNRYLTKHIMADFDPFFRRGLFEHARHVAT